jgi:hypothetical protein
VIAVVDGEYGRGGISTNITIIDKDRKNDDDHGYNPPINGGYYTSFAIDFGVLFGEREDYFDKTTFPKVSFPYIFGKNNVGQKFSWVEGPEKLGSPIYILRKSDIGIYEIPVIQRVYRFGDKTIFTARRVGTAVVYQIVDGNRLDDICYFANNVIQIPHGGE